METADTNKQLLDEERVLSKLEKEKQQPQQAAIVVQCGEYILMEEVKEPGRTTLKVPRAPIHDEGTDEDTFTSTMEALNIRCDEVGIVEQRMSQEGDGTHINGSGAYVHHVFNCACGVHGY